MTQNLGKLKRVDDLRDVWPHEAHSFTKWLAQEENLALLGEETGLSLRLVQTEAPVGRFNVDILAEEEETGQKIIIENQLEDSNHDHLGKLVTYAAGLDAKVVIWIFKEIRDEHRRAIDWLNEHTDPEVRLFGVKMELWQIDNSPLAPKFHVISAPNTWEKSVRSGLTQRRQYQLQFWDTFREFCHKHNSSFSLRKPSPTKWYSLGSIGAGLTLCGLNVNTEERKLGCEVHIPDNEKLFDYLEKEKKVEIERELGPLEWNKQPGIRRTRIGVTKEFEVIGSSSEFGKDDEAFRWLLNTAENFKRVFSTYLSAYNPPP